MIDEALPPAVQSALRRLTHAVLAHPLAAQSLYGALIAEGRRFARTPEGSELSSRIDDCELIKRMLTTFELASLGLLDEQAGDTLPSALVEAVARAAAEPWFEGKVADAIGVGGA